MPTSDPSRPLVRGSSRERPSAPLESSTEHPAPSRSPGSGSLVTDAWHAGVGSRLLVVLGLAVTAVWAIIVCVGTVRFMLSTVTNPVVPWLIKAGMVVLVPAVMLFLVVSLPMNWMAYLLERLDEHRRRRHRGRGPSE